MKKWTTALLLILMVSAVLANSFTKGNEAYLSGDYKSALEKYSEFIKKHPKYYEGYYNAGNALFRKEDYEGAVKMYDESLKLKPKDKDTIYNREAAIKKREQEQQKEGEKKNKSGDKNEETKDGNKGKSEGNSSEKEADGGGKKSGDENKISEDEAQAILNMMNRQEKQLKQYFGTGKKKQGSSQPDIFNMSPEEIMQYMRGNMNEPLTGQKSGKSGEKDW